MVEPSISSVMAAMAVMATGYLPPVASQWPSERCSLAIHWSALAMAGRYFLGMPLPVCAAPREVTAPVQSRRSNPLCPVAGGTPTAARNSTAIDHLMAGLLGNEYAASGLARKGAKPQAVIC